MAKKLYVGNLPYSVDDEALHQHFAQFGAVDSAKVIMDRETGRSKGFGFVEMADDSAADAAIEKANGADLNGRALNVSEARPQAPREGGPRRGGFGGGRGDGPRRSGGFGSGPRGPRN
ncbi:RNA-binding protein [Bdellovibrio sp. 22V]|uniref:RNA recognition motif domain-containing protein n=1 Tax=Bdellovibrio TaxID=958 RepID=UPI002542D9B1|nr:RNA-binding protein [Bdellovibrio sp. 22V]WII72185.1 RNA-binding protein [Bdellovibrio sp. 22V]